MALSTSALPAVQNGSLGLICISDANNHGLALHQT